MNLKEIQKKEEKNKEAEEQEVLLTEEYLEEIEKEQEKTQVYIAS